MSSQKADPTIYPQDIQCVLDPVGNVGGIFISNIEAASNLQTLKRHGIRAVLTAAFNLNLDHPKDDLPMYKKVPGKDHDSFNLSEFFQESVLFIQRALKTSNVLVHCMAGVSRSVTLVIAYLIKSRGMSYDEAYTMVKRRRKIIHPNDGFIQQLKTFEKQCRHRGLQSPSKGQTCMTKQVQSIMKKYQQKSRSPSKTPATYYKGYESPLKYNLLSPKKNNQATPTYSYNLQASPRRKTYGSPVTRHYKDTELRPNQDEIQKRIATIRKKYSGNTDSPSATHNQMARSTLHNRTLTEKYYTQLGRQNGSPERLPSRHLHAYFGQY